ncbi:YeiH family protein [Mycoplasma sp. P36-A1]|uniref:YeiH family protein n=1 Tax=Mycoplasma sp. P36-A1 TaxID=3252900 RepID=UPI003C2C9F86
MKYLQEIKLIIPGLVLSFIIAVFSKYLDKYLNVGAATIAIVIGIILGNIFFKQDVFKSGTQFSEKRLLEYSVALLGFSVTFKTLIDLGLGSIIYILLQVVITLTVGFIVGKKLGFSKKFSILMGAGNAICGSNAVAAVSGAIDAKEEEKGLAITMVNLLGTIMMFVAPIVTFYLYNNETFHTSALIGGVLQSVGQVVASAAMINNEVLDLSLIFKVVRILTLLIVVLLATKMNDSESKKSKVKFPWYVIAFFVIAGISTIISLPQNAIANIKDVSGWFDIIALAAIGLRLNINLILNQGFKLIAYILIIATISLISSTFLIGILL